MATHLLYWGTNPSAKPLDALDKMLVLSWERRKFSGSDDQPQSFVLHYWDLRRPNILIYKDNTLLARVTVFILKPIMQKVPLIGTICRLFRSNCLRSRFSNPSGMIRKSNWTASKLSYSNMSSFASRRTLYLLNGPRCFCSPRKIILWTTSFGRDRPPFCGFAIGTGGTSGRSSLSNPRDT